MVHSNWQGGLLVFILQTNTSSKDELNYWRSQKKNKTKQKNKHAHSLPGYYPRYYLYFMDVSLNLLYASNVENQDIKNGSSGFPGEKLSPSLLKDDV